MRKTTWVWVSAISPSPIFDVALSLSACAERSVTRWQTATFATPRARASFQFSCKKRAASSWPSSDQHSSTTKKRRGTDQSSDMSPCR